MLCTLVMVLLLYACIAMFLFHLCYLMHEQNLCVIYNAISNGEQYGSKYIEAHKKRYSKTGRIQITNTRLDSIILFFFYLLLLCICTIFVSYVFYIVFRYKTYRSGWIPFDSTW